MDNRYLKIVTFMLIFVFIAFLILKDPFIGLADNSDYYRVMQPLGFKTDGYDRYFNSYEKFIVYGMDEKNINGTILKILNPEITNNQKFISTQFIFIKISMIINFLVQLLSRKPAEIFDIRILGLTYAFIYSLGLYLFLKNIKLKSKHQYIILSIITIFVLCDIGYLVYFNSFFGEGAIISAAMITAGACLAFINSDKRVSIFINGIIFYIFSVILVGAKVANTPIGIFIVLFSVFLMLIKKDWVTRLLVVCFSFILMFFSVFYYISTPDWMSKVNNYNALFYGILKDSPKPDKDLVELGISIKYLNLANTHGFMNHGDFDIYGEEFQEEVFDNASFVQILKFYLKYPDRMLEKFIKSADNSVIIRPSYLGNFTTAENEERLSFTDRFSIWSNIRKLSLGCAIYIIVVYSVIFFTINIYEIIKAVKQKNTNGILFSLACFTLLLTAMSQFVLPIIGNGEADLQKHMLFFNFCFDLMIITGISWFMKNYKNKFLINPLSISLTTLVLFIIVVSFNSKNEIDNPLKIGNYVNFGNLNSEPIKWVVINYNESEGYLIWCEKAVDYREFDIYDEMINDNIYGSNIWEHSDIRNWLNTSFINNFSKEEQGLIHKSKLKNILNYSKIDNSAGGSKPYYWTAITSFIDENYNSDAYFNYSEDLIFLLDTYQLKNYVYDNKLHIKKKTDDSINHISMRYWLRTPYYSSNSMVRVVNEDGFVYHKDANVKALVVPAMNIKNNIKIDKGDGTKDNPYVVSILSNLGGKDEKNKFINTCLQ